MNEKLVCHYTHIEALQNIINAKKLKVTALGFLNDRNEFRYAKSITTNIFRKYFDEITKDKNSFSEEDLNKVFSKMMDVIFDPKKAGYVFCASKYENEDGLLTMWRAYGKINDAIGIVFKVNPNDPERYDTYVNYKGSLTKKDREDLGTKIEDIKQFIKCVLYGNPIKDHKTTIDLILKIGLKYKHPGFKDEREYRVCFCGDQENQKEKTELTEKKYIEIDFDPENINSVIIGPSNEQDKLEKRVRELLDNQRLDIPIKKSGIPFLWDKK